MQLLVILCASFGIVWSESSFAEDKKLEPEELVAEHLKSIGNPEVLAGIKNRGLAGTASVSFIQGGTGKMTGSSLFVSEGNKLGIIMKFGAVDYPGEYFAFDGKEVTVGYINPGQRSPLADFIYRYNGLTEEGLLGGVLSAGWSLLNTEEKEPKLKYDREKIEGRELHELQYRSKKGLDDVNVKLYFDLETFRHVMTEYRLRVRRDMSLQSDAVVTIGGATRSAGILDPDSDSIYVLVEKFDNFKEVDGLMLPHSYNIEYSVQGRGNSSIIHYAIEASQFMHNGEINPQLFKAQ